MRIKIVILFLFITLSISAQRISISGYVEDYSTGERLIGAAVYDTLSRSIGTFTNEYGYFSLTVPQGKKLALRISSVGYTPLDTTIVATHDLYITFKLQSSAVLEAVVVNGYRNQIKSSLTGRIDLPVSKVNTLPTIFGEPDLMKILQLLPGVQAGTEGTSGIYVRGGGPDQNLILLDGVPLYNVSHLAGFFSVFTPEAIKDVSIYKSGFPARFGGRLSSVLDVRMKDGNIKHLTGSVSIGLISSKFTIEGPTVKNKGSFIISARRTYFDVLARPVVWFINKTNNSDQNPDAQYIYTSKFNPGYYFYDLYAKLNHKLTPRDRIYLSFYSGTDRASLKTIDYQRKLATDTTPESYDIFITQGLLQWGNHVLALRWNHAFSKNLFVNTTLTYSKFFFRTFIGYGEEGMFYNYYDQQIDKYFMDDTLLIAYNLGINDQSGNINFDFMPTAKHHIRFGLQGTYHTFNPGQFRLFYDFLSIQNDTIFSHSTSELKYQNQLLYAPELSFYVEDDAQLLRWLKINFGVRTTLFHVRGKNFYSIEPRISGRILLTDNVSFKASYSQMTQYLHFVTNNTIGLPIDLWLPATDRVIPEKSWQAAATIMALLPQKITLSVEGFYKNMDNVVLLKEGNSFFNIPLQRATESWEEKVTQGRGWAYGAELFLRKNYGRLTGWLSYTLSWSWRQFDEINNGQPFPYKYDRRHEIDLAANYKLKNNLLLGFVWIYGSGTPVTLPQAEYYSLFYNYCTLLDENSTICYFPGTDYYGGRNRFRLPSYQRLDLSLNWSKKKQTGTRTWSFGIYNAYNHVNPFYTEMHYSGYGTAKTQGLLYLSDYAFCLL